MGRIFSDETELGLKYVCYEERLKKGKEGFEILEKASAAGDGDASCILARCLNGGQYIWSGHRFPVDEKRAEDLIRLSVEQGSALGALVSMRMGVMTPSLEQKMPFASLEEAYNIVLEKADLGDAFCQYAIGNVYFYWDFISIFGKGRDSFPSVEDYREYIRENVEKCAEWFQKAFRGGMYLAGNNLHNYYANGDSDVDIPPRPDLAEDIWRQGAQYGYPKYKYIYAEHLYEKKDYEEAFQWYKEAADDGEPEASFCVGKAYELGLGVEKNIHKALEWYEKSLAENGMTIATCNRLGAVLYKGTDGIPTDYGRAFQLLTFAYNAGSTWGVDCLGQMYFYGRGTRQDYVKARELLEKVDWNNSEAHYCLGCIYAQGLGVAEDIPKGVALLQKAGNYTPAKEELLKYKKTLFGKWVRRK